MSFSIWWAQYETLFTDAGETKILKIKPKKQKKIDTIWNSVNMTYQNAENW